MLMMMVAAMTLSKCLVMTPYRFGRSFDLIFLYFHCNFWLGFTAVHSLDFEMTFFRGLNLRCSFCSFSLELEFSNLFEHEFFV